MSTNKEDRERLRREYPDMAEWVANQTKDWPPISDNAKALCRKAMETHVAKLAHEIK